MDMCDSKRYRYYTFRLKLKAVKMYIDRGMSSVAIAEELNLSSYKRVMLWVKRYNEFGEDGLRERRGRPLKLNFYRHSSKNVAPYCPDNGYFHEI